MRHKYIKSQVIKLGTPGRTRTCYLLIRSQLLYPDELRRLVFIRNDSGPAIKLLILNLEVKFFLCYVKKNVPAGTFYKSR